MEIHLAKGVVDRCSESGSRIVLLKNLNPLGLLSSVSNIRQRLAGSSRNEQFQLLYMCASRTKKSTAKVLERTRQISTQNGDESNLTMVNQNGDHLSSPAETRDSKMWKLLSPSRNGQIPWFGIKAPGRV